MKLVRGLGLGAVFTAFVLGIANSSELVVTKICEGRYLNSWNNPAYENSFQPKKFWQNTSLHEQLVYLQGAIQMCNLLEIAPKYHRNLKYTDQLPKGCVPSKPYPIELEEQFEKAAWEILRKGYKISFDRFRNSLRMNLSPFDTEYSTPLLIHFSNYLVPRYEFHYKNEQCLKENIPYKTLKHPSKFEVVTGTPDVGVVVYEQKE